MLIYREFEHKENHKRLVLEIIFREADGKLRSAGGLIKSGKEPKGGFRNWCKVVRKMKSLEDIILLEKVGSVDVPTHFGWDSATLTRINQICEFSRKHPCGFVGVIQLKKEKEDA